MKYVVKLSLLVILLSSCGISKKKSQAYYNAAVSKAPYDAIIVPGFPHDGIKWSPTVNIRVSWANYLYKKGITSNIIFSGGAVYTKYCESKVFAEYAKTLGIPESHIFTDTLAEHSTENVYLSYLLAKKAGFKRIALATDPYQAKSLVKMINRFSLPIDVIPILFDTLRTIDRPEPLVNLENTIDKTFISIKDRESFFTRLNGTLGKQIIWHESDLPNKRVIKKMKRKGRLISG